MSTMPPHSPPPSTEPRRRPSWAGLLGAVAWAAFLTFAPARASAFDLAQLMQTMAAVRVGEATFVERREVAMLDRVVVSSGRLSFEAPDGFVRETLKPRRDRMAVAGNTLTLSQGSRSRTMDLDASPEAAVVVEAIRGTLTGNREAIERLFSPTLSGTPERWSLELVPRDARLRGQVASVRVGGRQALVHEVVVWLADGDRTVMTIEPVAASPSKAASDSAKIPTRPASAAR